MKSVALRGLESTTFKALGADLKTNHSHLFYYFASKEELFEACLRWVHGKIQDRIVSELSAHSDHSIKVRIQAYISAIFDCLQENPHFASTIVVSMHYAHYDDKYAQFYNRLRDGARNRIAEILAPCRLSEEKRRSIAHSLFMLIIGNIIGQVCEKPREPIAKLKKRLIQSALKLAES